MTGPNRFRRISRWIAPLLTAVLALAPLASGLHHHAGDDTLHASCVVCTTGHAPGVEASLAPRIEAPTPSNARVATTPILVIPRRLLTPAASRAPPLG